MPAKMPDTEKQAVRYIANLMAIHAEMLRRLAKHKSISLAQLGALAEDTGNLYIDIADRISRVTAKQGAPISCPQLSVQRHLLRCEADKHQS